MSCASGSSEGASGNLLSDRDNWREYISEMKKSTKISTMSLINHLHNFIRDITSKTLKICKDANACQMSMRCPSCNDANLPPTGGVNELIAMLDRMTSDEPPRVWLGSNFADSQDICETIRVAMLEINTHVETYFNWRVQVLNILGRSVNTYTDEVDSSIYYLVHQVIFLMALNNKMIMAVYDTALQNQAEDGSATMIDLRDSLIAASKENVADQSPLPNDEGSLLPLLINKNYSSALGFARARNAEPSPSDGDEIGYLLDVFAESYITPEMVALSRCPDEMNVTLSFIYEIIFKLPAIMNKNEPQSAGTA